MRIFSGAKFALILGISALAINCSGKTYSTFFQPFDLVFGGSATTANPSVSVSLLAATPLTNTRVMLTFNKPVSLSSSQLTSNYRITDSSGNLLNILAVSRDPNNSNIVFVDTIPQASGSQYTVTASNIVGVDGASLGSSNSATFTAPNNADQTGPAFGSVSAINATTVEVYFNEAVSQTVNNATFGGYFDLYTNAGCTTGNVNVTSAVRDTSNFAKVTLTNAAMVSGTTYYLCGTANVRDIWGNANTTVISGAATFVSGSFVYSAPTPRVLSAVSSSPSSVLVTFDQAMSTTGLTLTGNPGNYTFSSCGALANNTTGATITAINGNTQVLITGLTTGTAGTCRVTVNTAVTSAAGAALTGATNTALFSYSSSAATDTTAPTVVGVTTTNSNTIVVTFSENVTGATIADFSLSPALNISAVNCVANVCTLTTADQSTTAYSLSVTNAAGGIQDTATPANTLSSGSTTFTGDGKPYIVAYYPIDSGTVLVEWSEPIGNAASINTAVAPFDYAISGAVITAVAQDPAGTDPSKFVKLTISPVLTSGTTYTLTYADALPAGSADPTGNLTLTTVPGGGTFTGPTATTKPLMVSASSPSATTVLVTFNEPLFNPAVANTAPLAPGAFTIGGLGCPAGVPTSATQIQAGVIQLVIPGQVADAAACTVTVTAADAVYDLAGNGNAAGLTHATAFAYTGTGGGDSTPPTIASVVSLSNTQIKVFFSEPMKIGANGMDVLGSYSISPALTVLSFGTCASNTTSCVINTGAQTTATYTLSISAGMQDFNNVATTGTLTSTFIGTGGSATAPSVYQAVLINSTTVEVSFSEIMDLTTSQNTANYSVSGGNTVSAAVRQADATKVRLTITPGAYGSSNSYTVTGGAALTDASGNVLGTPNSATFSGSATAPSTTNLADGSDLGSSNTDNITSAAFPAPGLQFTGTVAANTTVLLYYSPTASFTDAGDLVTLNAHGYTNGQTVSFSSINSTTGISSNVTYYVISATANTFQLSTTPGGAAIPLTTNGSGVLNSNIPLGTAVSAADGSYSITVTSGTNIAQGTNVFSVATVGPTGLVSDISPGLTVTYDSSAPAQPTNVTSTLADGTYGIGQVVDIRVTFPEVVYVTGTPLLTISTGTPVTTDVSYSSGSGTNTLVFNYTVASGHTNSDLNYASVGALGLNGGSIGDLAGNAAGLTLPGLAAAGSLATNKALNINGVVSGTITYDQSGNTTGPFKTGTVTITATYATAPGSTPTIAINQQGTNDIAATAMSGGPNIFTYTYTVNAAGGANADGTASITLSTPSVPASPSFVIDTTNPTAPSGVTAPGYTNATSVNITYTNGADTNFSTHNVKACTANDCTTGCVGAATDAASPVTISGLTNGTSYFACIQSLDSAGNFSVFVPSGSAVVVDTTNPAAPSGVTVPTYSTTTSVVATYTDGTDTNFSTHNIKACTSNDCATGCVGAATDAASTSTISSLVNGTAYYACIQSLDLAGNTSAFVASAGTVTVDTTDPAAPSGVTVPSYVNATSVNVTYTNGTDTNFSTHNVKACTANDCATGCVGAATDAASPVSISGLSTGTSYYACIQSVDLAGRTSAFVPSGTTVTVDTTNPAAPSGVTVPTYTNSTSVVATYTNGTDTNFSTHNIKACTSNDCATGCVGASTDAASTSTISSLVNGTAYYACIQSLDLATNTSAFVASAGTVTVDTAVPTISSVAPATNAYVKDTVVSYTFSEAVASGTITWARTGGAADGASHVQSLSGGELATGAHTSITLASPPTLVSGAIYTITWNATDAAGNAATAVLSTNVTYDTTLPVISAVTPASSASVNSTSVSYTLSEVCQSGSITWTRTGGSADTGGSPAGTHTQALTGSELNAGTFTGNITNNPTLVDGAIYSVAFNCTDRAGNVGTTVTSTNVTYSPGVLAITTADTLDTDNDGKIDTYRVSFNKPVNDSTFPGYSLNALGTVTANWLVAGYTNVRLIHGTAVTFATDTANDAVIYIRFDENVQTCSSASQVGCDTEAKPDLTTTATPGLQDLTAATLAQVTTGSVTESDQAKPVLIAARSLSTTTADAIFSETVETTTAQTATNYVITGGSNPTVSTATRDTTNTNIVHLVTGTQTGGQAYVLTVNTNVKDNANLSMNSSANTANFTGVQNPVVSSVVTTSATTLTITFNESVTAASTECSTTTACAAIFDNSSIAILSAVSTAGAGNNAATYTLTVNPMVEGQSYTVTVLQNTVTSVATGNKMLNTNNSATFSGDGKPAATISADTVTTCPAAGADQYKKVIVQYDQSVSATALTTTNYKITGCVTGTCSSGATGTNTSGAAAVTSLGGNKYEVKFTDQLLLTTALFQLTVSGVQDNNSNTIAAPGNLTFQCGSDSTKPMLAAATVVTATAGSTVVLLSFSEAIDNVTGNTSTNYKYDSQAYGANVLSASRQSNTAQVLVTFQPALANGGHQIRVQNVQDLAANSIDDNGATNVQPILVNAPTGFSGGPVFNDPFGDGAPAGAMVLYKDKIVLGWDLASSKLFEMDKGLTTAQTLILDADGSSATPYTKFQNYTSTVAPGTTGNGTGVVLGIDAISAGCIGGTSTPLMTGTACTGASGTEYMFIGGYNGTGGYRTFWTTTDSSASTSHFTFTERGGLTNSNNTYRSMNMTVFRDYLIVASPHRGTLAPRVTRVCIKAGGCANGQAQFAATDIRGDLFNMIGKGGSINNSTGNTGGTAGGNTVSIDTMWEYDNDGTGGTSCGGATCPSALYLANGGRLIATGYLSGGSARDNTSRADGGVLRTRPAYSTAASPPICAAAGTCDSTVFENITPSSTDWRKYMSIALPYEPVPGGDWDSMLPANRIIPAIKAVPYMRTAPNGDLYMLRNACATETMQTKCMSAGTGATVDPCPVAAGGAPGPSLVNDNFVANRKQTCPPGYEVPQLWVLPKASGASLKGAADWVLVASTTFDPGTGSRKATTMRSNTGTCGSSPNKCEKNAHFTLIEFVGNYMYLGFDNQDYGANIWRVDMNSATCTGSASCATSGNYPAETSFTIVNSVLGLDGSATNQRIFSHLTVNDSGKDWLILATRDGSNAMKIYRTANDQN